MSGSKYNLLVLKERDGMVAFTLSVNSTPCNITQGSFITMSMEDFLQFVVDLGATVTRNFPIIKEELSNEG